MRSEQGVARGGDTLALALGGLARRRGLRQSLLAFDIACLSEAVLALAQHRQTG